MPDLLHVKVKTDWVGGFEPSSHYDRSKLDRFLFDNYQPDRNFVREASWRTTLFKSYSKYHPYPL